MGDEADHDYALVDAELGYEAAGVLGWCMRGHQVITAGPVEACIECGAPVHYDDVVGGGSGVTDNRSATELDAIEQRANDATEGPWFVERDGIYDAAWSYLVVPVGDSARDITDAAFIACARTDVPRLVAALRSERTQTSAALKSIADQELMRVEIADLRAELERERTQNRRTTPTPAEWQNGITDDTPCFVSGCDYTDIDVRGPIVLRGDATYHYACTEHWEAIVGILGRQVRSDDEHRPARAALSTQEEDA